MITDNTFEFFKRMKVPIGDADREPRGGCTSQTRLINCGNIWRKVGVSCMENRTLTGHYGCV